MPSTLDRATIYAQFIAIVYNPSIAATMAVWHSGNFPNAYGFAPAGSAGTLGAAALPAPSSGRLPSDLDTPSTASETSVSRVFYILHQFAMELTRRRQVHYYYTNGTWVLNNGGSNLGALPAGLEMTIDPFSPPDGMGALPLPPAGPIFNLNAGNLTPFLNRLRACVANIQANSAYEHIVLTYCHSNCHSSCHGSRSRR